MAETKTKKSAKKSFYDLDAPMTSVKISLYGSSVEEFDGKVVKLDLTKSLRGRSVELKMKIENENGALRAVPISANLAGSYIRRALRKGSDNVEDSFSAECMDAIVIMKPFLITRMKVSRAVRRVLRDNAKKYILDYIRIRSVKELFSDIITNKLQKGMSLKLKKIYPLAFCEIRVFEVVEKKKDGENEIAEVKILEK